MFCRKCGEKIPDDSVFCAKCGTRVNDPEETDASDSKSDETEPIHGNVASQKKTGDEKKENVDNDNESTIVIKNNFSKGTSVATYKENKIENNTTINKWISNKYVKYGIIAAAIILLIVVTVLITNIIWNDEATTENSTVINYEEKESGKVEHKGKWWPDGMYVYDGGPKGSVEAYEFETPDLLYSIRDSGEEIMYHYKFIDGQMFILNERDDSWAPIMFEYVEEGESKHLIHTDSYNNLTYFKYVGEGRKRSSESSKSDNSANVPEFDPFENLNVEFKGMSGAATATISGDLHGLKASVDPNSGLKNGDKVRVTIDASNLDIYVAQHNKKPNSLEKEYTVEGLGSYVLEKTSFTEEFINTINISGKEQAEKYIADCCKASSKNSFLINQADKVLLTWETAGKATSDPKLLRIDAGTNNDGSGNMMLLLYEVPYEAFVKKDGSGRKEDGKVIGSGSAYVVIIYKNATVYGDSNDSVGQYENHGIRETKEELFDVKEKYKDLYTFISIDVRNDKDPKAEGEESSADMEKVLQVYDDYMKENFNSKYGDVKISLLYFTNDDIPDAVIEQDGDISWCIVTYNNSDKADLLASGTDLIHYAPKRGRLYYEWSDGETSGTVCYMIEEDKRDRWSIDEVKRNDDTEYHYSDFNGDKTISESEAQKYYNDAAKDCVIFEGKFYLNAEEAFQNMK